MAVENKDFKVKNGLVVQGSSATVAGNQVLTVASNLQDLANIDITGLSDGDVLIYDSETSTWIPGETTGGGGGGASVTVSETPPGSPSTGDLWYNSAVGKTYIYYDSFWVEANPAQMGPDGKFNISSTAPSNPIEGQVWYNSDTGRFYVFYDDFWVEASSNEAGPQGRYFVGEVSQENPVEGDTWFNSTTGRFYIYYDGYWVENTSSLAGPSGIVNVTSPITNSGTSKEAVIGIQSSAIVPSQTGNAGEFLVTNGTASSWSNTVIANAANVPAIIARGAPGQSAPLQEWRTPDLLVASIDTNGFITAKPAEPAVTNSAKAVGYVGMPQIIHSSGDLALGTSANYSGKHIYVTGNGATITILDGFTFPIETGTTFVVVNASGVTSTIRVSTNTLILANVGQKPILDGLSTVTLAPFGMATFLKITTSSWIASGNGLT